MKYCCELPLKNSSGNLPERSICHPSPPLGRSRSLANSNIVIPRLQQPKNSNLEKYLESLQTSDKSKYLSSY